MLDDLALVTVTAAAVVEALDLAARTGRLGLIADGFGVDTDRSECCSSSSLSLRSEQEDEKVVDVSDDDA